MNISQESYERVREVVESVEGIFDWYEDIASSIEESFEDLNDEQIDMTCGAWIEFIEDIEVGEEESGDVESNDEKIDDEEEHEYDDDKEEYEDDDDESVGEISAKKYVKALILALENRLEYCERFILECGFDSYDEDDGDESSDEDYDKIEVVSRKKAFEESLARVKTAFSKYLN